MQRRISIRRIIGLVIAITLSVVAIRFAVAWYRYAAKLDAARTQDIARFDVDFSQPGSTEATYKATFGFSHGMIACLHAATPEPSWPGLEGRVEIIDADGEVDDTWPLPPDDAMPPANVEPPLIPLAHIRYLRAGRIRVTIDHPADAGDLHPQVVVRHEMCGLEGGPLIIFGFITVICALPAAIIGIYTTLGFFNYGWRPAVRQPDTEI